jgi:ribonuclease P protein component
MIGHEGDSRDRDEESPVGAQAPRRVETAAFGKATSRITPAAFERLKERSEFLAVAKGARMHEAAFTLQGVVRQATSDQANSEQAIAPEAGEPARRFGLTVTKKTGNSVVRNRIRRRLREALRASGIARDEVADGAACDYVIVARREALSRDFGGLTHDITASVKRIDRRLASGQSGAKPRRVKPPGKPAD